MGKRKIKTRVYADVKGVRTLLSDITITNNQANVLVIIFRSFGYANVRALVSRYKCINGNWIGRNLETDEYENWN